MKREWNADELAEQWSLRPEEKALLGNKNGATRLGFAVLLKYFQHEGRFPRQRQEVPHVIIRYLARHIGVAISEWSDYLWQRRTLEYHRAQIREFLGFGEATVEDSNSLSNWLVGHILAKDQNPDHIASEIINRRRALHIEPPAPDRFDRIIRSALSAFEKQFCDAITERLSPQTCERLDALLSPDITGHEGGASPPEQMRAVLTGLLADPGAAKLENLLEMTQRLDRLRSLEIPDDLFQNLAPRIVQSYRQRVAVESPYELRRHAMPLLAAFGSLRKSELTDGLIELLLSTVHRIASKAERRVQKEWINDLKRVTGKNSLLFQVAEHRYRSRKESSRKWSIRW